MLLNNYINLDGDEDMKEEEGEDNMGEEKKDGEMEEGDEMKDDSAM
jgi:hypothetical protein